MNTGRNRYLVVIAKVRRRTEEAEKNIKEDFFDMQKNLRHDVQSSMDENEVGEKTHQLEVNIENKVEKDVDTTEAEVEKTVEDEDKDL